MIFSDGPTIRIFSDSDIGLTAQASEIDFWQFAAAKKIYCDIVEKICKTESIQTKTGKLKSNGKIFVAPNTDNNQQD